VEPRDLALRNRTYRLFVELGRAPAAEEVAADAGSSVDAVVAGWRRLHEAHALVLNAATDELRMAAPFSAVPTAYRVQARGRWWYANCAWDAFGVLAALDVDGHVSSSCPDCAEPIEITVHGGEPVDDDHVVHVNVPAAHWWDDIVFT
jgi:Alkylmercury lyase